MKTLIQWVILIGLALFCLALLDKSCQPPDPALWTPIANHNAAIAEAELQHRADQIIIKAAKETIAYKDGQIVALLDAASKPTPAELAKDREIADLEKAVAGYEAQGDLAGALAAVKAECSAWAEKFSLAAGKHQDSLSALNKAWQAKFDAQVIISEKWESSFNREHALRLGCEDLSADLQKQAPAAAFERVAHEVQGLGTGIYAAARYKDPLPLAVYAGEKLAVKLWRLFHR